MAVPVVEISRFECRAFFDFHRAIESDPQLPRTKGRRDTGVSRLNSSEINDGHHTIIERILPFLSLFSLFPRDFIFNVAIRYSIQPTQRTEGGEKEEEERGKMGRRRGAWFHTQGRGGLNNSNLSVLEKLNLIIQSNRKARTVTSRGDHSTGRTRSKMQYPGSIS